MEQADIIARMKEQILSQNITKYWTGEGHGSYDKNAEAMATLLSNAGITDINQLGKRAIKEEAQVGQYKIGNNIAKSYIDEYGNTAYYVQSTTPDGDIQNLPISKEQFDKATPEYGTSDYEGNFIPIDPSKLSVENGKTYVDTGRVEWINKTTGQALTDSEYGGRGLHPLNDSNLFGQTFAGSGGTAYGVQFVGDKPYFYSQFTGDTSDWGTAVTIASMALMAFPGVGTAIGATLGATGTAATVVGNALISGTLAEMSGGQFLKGAVTGAITAGANTFAGDVGAMFGLEGKLAQQVGTAMISAARAEIAGGDALSAAATSGLISTVSEATGFSEKDIKSGVAALKAFESGDPTRIATSLAGLTKLDYFNDKKTAEILQKLNDNSYVDREAPTQEEIENWLSTPDYQFKTTEEIAADTVDQTEKAFDATEISHGGKAGDTSYEGINDFGVDKSTDLSFSMSGAAAGLATGLLTAKAMENKPLPVDIGALDTTVKTTTAVPDIYKDAPLKGFAMRKVQNSAGDTKYIPYVGDKAQLTVPTGYSLVGFKSGGFVSRRT